MNTDEMVEHLTRAIALNTEAAALTTEVRNELAHVPPRPPDVIDVTPGQSVQAAIDAAPYGATVRLAPGTYDGAITMRQSVRLVPRDPPPNGQATRNASAWLTSSADATVTIPADADDVAITGLGVKNANASGEWITAQGSRIVLDRVTGLGDPLYGQHRGVRVECRESRILHCYMDDVFLVGRESSVIGAWQDTEDLTIDGSYFCGGAETIMFGGADAPAADRIPANITITNCTLTKNPAWYAMGAQLKNAFELKCAIGVRMTDCLCEYAGVAEGQSAYLLVLTVRNQDGHAPWSTIEDVTIERCLFRYGGGGVNILGSDDQHASETLAHVTIRECRFAGLNPQGYWSQGGSWGAGRCVTFDRAPHAVTFDAITMEGVGMSALGYFANTPKQPTALTLRNWKYCATEYGWKIDDGGLDHPPAHTNISALMPDLVYEITDHDPGALVPAIAATWRS